ncbi:MAG TPA: LacI family DNA-binding transcriptional regulator [Alphaproteobacteria bacterium]|nr:LacI family DNA-binding transcriptional regulator [Alphaproteobacteria bacterium]
MVSVVDVARRAGVSVATVSRVLSGADIVAADTKLRVMRSVRELGYQPNVIAQSLRRGQSRTVALVTGDIEQGIYAALAKEVQRRFSEIDLDLMLVDTAHDEKRLAQLLARAASLGLRGLLLALPHFMRTGRLRPLLRKATEQGVSIISVSQKLDNLGLRSIVPDDKAGAVLAVRHLLERGHERIAFLGRTSISAVARLRFEGYRIGLMPRLGRIPSGLAWDIARGYRFKAGYEAVSQRLKSGVRFDAVLASSDELALGGMAAALDQGRRVPEDIAFVGFGGLQWGRYIRPALTSVEVDVAALASFVVEFFRERTDDGEDMSLSTLVPYRLIPRGSS